MTEAMTLKAEDIAAFNEPESLKKLRKRALEIASGLGLPAKNIESWRKINLKGLNLSDYQSRTANSDIQIEGSPAGVRTLSLAEAIEDPALKEIIQKRLEESLEVDAHNVFAMMNLAAARGIVVHVSGTVEEPIFLKHSLKEGNTLNHHVFVVLDDNAEINLIEEFNGKSFENTTLWMPTTDIRIGQNAHIKYVSLRNYTDCEYHFHNFTIDQMRDSTANVSIVHLGGVSGKGLYTARIREEGASFLGLGVGVGSDREFHDIEMHAEHYAGNSNSQIRYKTVLTDRAHHVFDGNLHIPKGLKNVDSYQVNHNIILDPRARAESMPRLVTEADSVQCEHGATVGQLDDEAIFFLMARGLTEKQAKDLLIRAFIAEIVEKMPLTEEMIESIETAIGKKIGS